MQTVISSQLFARAKGVFVDGTTRITVERDPIPRYATRGEGAYLIDADGNRILDLNNNFTTLIHGHAYAPIEEALIRQIRSGTCFANPTEHEIVLAELLCERVPAIDSMRFVNSGSEAVMFAIKAARAFTGRSAIAKIEGAYHGSYDWAEVSQASSPANWGPASAPASVVAYRGAPASVLDEVVTLRLNDPESADRLIRENGQRLAAILLDPTPSRAGLITPTQEFIAAVTKAARAHGVLLIADEVLNFRQAYQGASHRHHIDADLITLGKIIGGGLPIGAIGGRHDVMSVFDAGKSRPLLPQGGTFSANPLSMVAGLASMRGLTPAAFAHLETLGEHVRSGLRATIDRHGVPLSVTGVASLFRIHPSKVEPREYRDTVLEPPQVKAMSALNRHFVNQGVLMPLGAAASLSMPMTTADCDLILSAFEEFVIHQPDLMEALAHD